MRWHWRGRAALCVFFLAEGPPMAQLLSAAAAQGIMPDYTGKLLAVFAADEQKSEDTSAQPPVGPLVDPLSRTRVGSTSALGHRTLES